MAKRKSVGGDSGAGTGTGTGIGNVLWGFDRLSDSTGNGCDGSINNSVAPGGDPRLIDRRSFVVGAAGLGAAALAGAVLAGCSEAASKTDSGSLDASTDEGASSITSANSATSENTTTSEAAQVFFTRDISPSGLMRVWQALGAEPEQPVAVKLSTGEPGGSNFLQPDLIAELVQSVGGVIVECNTAYGGQRTSTESHLQAAADHGFTAIAEVDIMDAEGSLSLPVSRGSHLTEDLVGSHLERYGFVLSLAHFKGHAMAGFGGAIKNCSIGIASADGKRLIHSAGTSTTSFGNPSQDDFLETMAEAAKAVADHFDGRMAYVNVMNKLSVDCDCDSHPADPDMEDIGVLASLDPVALDRACVDLVYAASDGASLVSRMESRNGAHALAYAEQIGLGSQVYELVDLGLRSAGA